MWKIGIFIFYSQSTGESDPDPVERSKILLSVYVWWIFTATNIMQEHHKTKSVPGLHLLHK